MNWPIYPHMTDNAAILRHNARQSSAPTRGAPALYAAAADVWRDGVHVWRSWPESSGESVDDYALRAYGALYPSDHDNGVWGVPGVQQIADWPVPTESSMTRGMSLQAIHDAMVALLAIAQLPEPPHDMDSVPSHPALVQRLARGGGNAVTVAARAGIAAVRFRIAKMEAPAAVAEGADDFALWRARLAARPMRRGAVDVVLPERDVTFRAPAGASVSAVARAARAALHLTGWQMQQRTPPALVWHLTRAPYIMTLERLS